MLPFITIKLDRPRQIRFTYRASVEFEQITGIKMTNIQSEISFELCAKILWIMLKQEDKKLSFDQTLDLIDNYAENSMVVISAVTKAIQDAIGKNAKSPNA